MLSESVQIRVPGSSCPHIKAALTSLFQNFVPCVFHRYRSTASKLERLRKDHVERAIFLPALLHKVQILSFSIRYASDPQVGQQPKLENSLSRCERLECDGCAAKQVLVLGDDC